MSADADPRAIAVAAVLAPPEGGTAVPAAPPTGVEDAGEVAEPTSALRLAARTFAENRLALASLVVLVFLVLFCFVGPLIYHTDQVSANLLAANEPPSAAHLLGTSPEGRDELGRLMVGGQSTLEVGFAVAALATAFGVLYGALAGYVGGIVDAVLMRIVDAMLSIPFLFFVVLLAALVQANLLVIILVLTSVSWVSTARLVRGETLSLRTREYVVAAEGFGARRRRVIGRHVVPNLLGVVVVNATLKVADNILAFASISYLGLGPPPPATNWGTILSTGINNLFDGYWWELWPAAVLIVVTVLAVNVIGDALADVTEIRLQKR